MTEEYAWVDITEDIIKLPRSFKLLEIVKDEKFPLEDSMHAHQINDNKIDPKYDIAEEDAVGYMLKNNVIKLPNQLSIEEILAIFIQISKAEALVLKGYSLYNTIYTFTYLYDSAIYQQNSDKYNIICTLINSINSVGSYVYELHKQSCSIKEDDLSICMFSFSTTSWNSDQIIKEWGTIETLLNNQMKKPQSKEKLKCYEMLISLIKLRKSIQRLTKSMGKYYEDKMLSKIQKDIKTARGVIQSLEALVTSNIKISQTDEVLVNTGIFSNKVAKVLRSHFGSRDIPIISFKQSIQCLNEALEQFELFLPIPTRLSILRDKIQKLHEMPLNLWSKSYIKNNMFHKQQHIFNTIKTEDLIINDMSDYLPFKENWKSQQKFIALIKPTGPVISEVMFRYLGRNSRSFWEVSKVYEDFNILIHLSNQFDASIFPVNKKELYMSSWYYNFGLSMMVKQLFSGIQTQLYQHYEYPYVFYLLQNILGVADRNAQIFLKKFDKSYLQSFFEESLNNKKKKKINEASRKYFADCTFKKALHYYVRSFHRLLFVMLNRKLISNPFLQNEQLMLKNRFRIFKNIFFVKTIDYNQYKHDYQIIVKDEIGYLNEAMELLKQAKGIFMKLTQLQESDCNYQVKEDSQNLAKICVKCSLAVMSLKMGQNTKTYKIQNKHGKYPQITVC